MTQAVAEAMIISADAVTAGAVAIADAFGLGDTTMPSADWPVDDGDSTFAATIEGALAGSLFLAANGDVAARLSSDSARLQNGFQRALDAIVETAGIAGEVVLVDVGPSTLTPTVSVEIHDGEQLCALFGFASVESIAASDDATTPGRPAGTEAAAIFEPAQLAQNGAAVATPSLGPLTLLQEVEMDVTVELGRTRMPIRELLALQPGMVVELDRIAGTPIDILVNGRPIACGEVVVIDEEFGIRITEIVDTGARI